MNMKKNNKGFSLVELIVVIAIMAVLAAVAVIGVSIYIPKAEQQADNTLLADLSDSFRVACLSEGVDPAEANAKVKVTTGGALASDGNGGVQFMKLEGMSDSQKAEILRLFNDTVKGSKKVQFNTYADTYLVWNGGEFVVKDNPTDKMTIDGKEYVYNDKAISDYNNSAFKDIGSVTLMQNVDSIVEQAEALDPGSVQGFNEFYTTVLGKSLEDSKEKKMDALVLYAAYLTNKGDIDSEDLEKYFMSTSPESVFPKKENDMVTDEFVVAEAMKYAIGMAWVRAVVDKYPESGQYKVSVDPNSYDEVMGAMLAGNVNVSYMNRPYTPDTNLTNFSNWYNTKAANGKTNGENAIAGYTGAMGLVDTNRGNLELGNGFEDYADVIDQLTSTQ